MTNITRIFEEVYLPIKAILIYQPLLEEDKNVYVEAYDIDENGSPVNAHPLSINEATTLAENLNSSPDMQRRFCNQKDCCRKIFYISIPIKTGLPCGTHHLKQHSFSLRIN